jgi:hypothetical protein
MLESLWQVQFDGCVNTFVSCEALLLETLGKRLAFGVHTAALILPRDAFDASGSHLLADKRQYGFGFACDEPGRGGTCQILSFAYRGKICRSWHFMICIPFCGLCRTVGFTSSGQILSFALALEVGALAFLVNAFLDGDAIDAFG